VAAAGFRVRVPGGAGRFKERSRGSQGRAQGRPARIAGGLLRAALGRKEEEEGDRQVGPSSQRKREGERGLGEELGRARGKKERSGPRKKKREAGLLLGQLGWFRVFPIFLVSFPLSLSNQLKSI
jgi:hypothetical protein